jgi:hypothetical protein
MTPELFPRAPKQTRLSITPLNPCEAFRAALELSPLLAQTEAVIRTRVGRLEGPDGLERRLALQMAANPLAYRLATPEGAVAVKAPREESPIEAVAYRDPSEALTRRLISALRRRPITSARLLAADGASCWRSMGAFIHPDGQGIVLDFCASAEIPGHLRRLVQTLRAPEAVRASPLVHAVAAMVALLSIHPLPDGNGRMARSLAQAILVQKSLIRGPVLPLGPILKINGAAHAGAFRAAAFQADWRPILTFFAAAFARTAHAVAALQGAPDRSA